MSADATQARIAELLTSARERDLAGDAHEAERLAQEALGSAEQAWGREDPRIIPVLQALAHACRPHFKEVGDRPIPPLLRAVSLAERSMAPDDRRLGPLYGQLGIAFRSGGRLQEARDVLLKAVSLSEQSGQLRDRYFFSGALVGVLLETNPEEAIPYCAENVDFEAKTAPNGIEHFTTLFEYGKCLILSGRARDAVEPLEQAQQMLARAAGGARHRWMKDLEELLETARAG